MTKTKHTPGPWFVFNGVDIFTETGAENANGVFADDNDGWHIATDGRITKVDGIFQEMEYLEKRANAVLIASAPEMLELLKELCQLVKESARIYDNPFEGDDKIFESIKKSQLVINKAESK